MRRRSAVSTFCGPLVGGFFLGSAVVSVALPAAPSAGPSAAEAVVERAVLEARVNSKPIELPIVDADDLRFAHLSTAQGLSQTRVQQIAQDDDGFLWFGTQYGLNRYDGYRFKVFVHDSSRINSLGGVHIYSLFKDRQGYLWIGCANTLDRFYPKRETFIHYRLQRSGSIDADVNVFHINQDKTGAIWLATGSGLFKLDVATGKTTLFQHNSSDPLSLASSDVKSTLEDRSH